MNDLSDGVVHDVYGFEVEENVESYKKQEKKRLVKEEKSAKKWEVLFLKYKRKDDELFNSNRFKKLVAKGIPIQYRGFVWYTFSGAAARATRANTTGSDIPCEAEPERPRSTTTTSRPKKGGSRVLKVSYYQDLQRQLRNLTTGSRRISAALEIEKDLLRTFPGHPLFDQEDGKSILRRILLAYALRNPAVGYCQSMNVLAAFILLVTQPSRQHQYHNPSSENNNTNVNTNNNNNNNNNPSNESNNTTSDSHPLLPRSPSQDGSAHNAINQSTHNATNQSPHNATNQSPHNPTTQSPQVQSRSSHQRKQSSLPFNLAEQWEERAFWILVEMIEGRCVDYYTRTLRGSQVDLRVLSQVLALHLPALTNHFETLGLSLPLLSTRWFMCVFALVLPVHTSLHVWDQVLVHSQLTGTSCSQVARDYIVLYAAGLLQCAQDAILQKGEGEGSVSDIVLLLDSVPRVLYNKKELLRHYNSVSFRLPPGGELMTNMRQSATEHVDAETQDIRRARDLMQAARQTKFTSVELSEIHATLFKSSASLSDRGSIAVSVEGFQNILSHMAPGIAQSPAVHRLFKALDHDNDNKLDFREMICGLSILAKGTSDEKLELLFRSFDVDNSGYITQTQLEALINSVSSQMDPDADKNGGGVVGTDPLGGGVVPVSTFVAQVFDHLRVTTGKLSLGQFRQAVSAEPRLIECLMIGEEQEEVAISRITRPKGAETKAFSPSSNPNINTATSSQHMHETGNSTRDSSKHPTRESTKNAPKNSSKNSIPHGATQAENTTPLLSDTDNDSEFLSPADEKNDKPSKSRNECGCCCLS